MAIGKEELSAATPLKIASANSHNYVLEKEGEKILVKCSVKTDSQTRAMYLAENEKLSASSYPDRLHPRYPKHFGFFESVSVGGAEYGFALAMEMVDANPIVLKEAWTRNMREAALLIGTAVYTLNYTNSIGYYHMDIEPRNCLIDAQNPYQLWIVDYTGAMCSDYSSVSISYPFMRQYPIYHQHVQLRALLKAIIDNQESAEALEKVERYISGYKSRPGQLKDFIGLLECLGFSR